MLINVGRQRGGGAVHEDDCAYARRYGTKLKPYGHLGKDGGWLEGKSLEEVVQKAKAATRNPHLPIHECSFCRQR